MKLPKDPKTRTENGARYRKIVHFLRIKKALKLLMCGTIFHSSLAYYQT